MTGARVVVNGRFLAARPTGLQRVARSLLAAARAAGLDALVAAPRGVHDPMVDRWLPTAPGRGGDQLFEQLALPAYAGQRLVLSLCNTAPLLARRNAVMVHDLAASVGPQWFHRSMRAYNRLVLAVARRAERVFTVSAQVRDELVRSGVRPEGVALIRPAVPASCRPAGPGAVVTVLRRLRIVPPYALFVGWADPRKDLATALAAHRRAVRVLDHRLVLVGRSHPTFARVNVPPDPSVHLVGYVEDEELWTLLTGAAALLYPSRYEGFGLPPLEAWCCGVPALVSDLPSVREATENRAVYLPAGDLDRWADGLLAALGGQLPVPEPVRWTWADAAGQLLAGLPG